MMWRRPAQGEEPAAREETTMKILVLGGGVIGVTTAYYLARDGHEVELVDRQPGPALETSFANAGEVSPGYSSPWAGPGVPVKAVKWLLMHHRPLVVRALLDPAMWRWGLQTLANCNARAYAINKSRMVPLAEYSRDCLKALRAETGIEYDHRTQGTLQLFRTQKQLDGIGGDVEVLQQYGVPFEVLDREGFCRVEPALRHTANKFIGALRLPGDETGDCNMFTNRLAGMAAALGVRFRWGAAIERLEIEGGAGGGAGGPGRRLAAVHTSAGRLTADRVVLALGSHSPKLLAPVGIRIPVYPVKGYSITLPVTDPAGAPESTIMDETHKVAVTRLGDRIRVGGTAELAGYDERLHEARRQTLAHVVSDLFPHGGDVAKASFWCGLRPMTPDGTPIVGPAPVEGLILATGHGTLGWTMAAGTGRVVADMVAGRQPAIDSEGLGLERYGLRVVGRDATRPPRAAAA
jgi:D-amino-acid dehydrogenase